MEKTASEYKPLISVISPVYKAEGIVTELVKRITEELSAITDDYEVILVEDCGPDFSWIKIQDECRKNHKVKGIKLSRNFGQHYAISAGIEHAKGDYIIVMDCDLQDNPVYIKELYKLAQSGYDLVFTYKENRNHSFFKNITARIFYRIYNYLLDNKQSKTDKNIGTYSLINRKVANAFMSIKEHNRDYSIVLQTLGFNRTYIQVQHEPRYEGKSTYNIARLLSTAINVITAQSDKLLRLSITVGFAIFFASVLWAIYTVYRYFNDNIEPGYSSISIFVSLGTGLILMSLGIVGIYIGKIYEQVKQRPLYHIGEKINC